MDFGAYITIRSYREIPTGALRPRNDIPDGAVQQRDKLKFTALLPLIHLNDKIVGKNVAK